MLTHQVILMRHIETAQAIPLRNPAFSMVFAAVQPC